MRMMSTHPLPTVSKQVRLPFPGSLLTAYATCRRHYHMTFKPLAGRSNLLNNNVLQHIFHVLLSFLQNKRTFFQHEVIFFTIMFALIK